MNNQVNKDHWDPGLFNMLHITFILSNGVAYLDRHWGLGIVCLDQLTGARHTRTYLTTIEV